MLFIINAIIFLWNWSNAMNVCSVLWVLMVWGFSIRASVTRILSTHPCISRCLWVNLPQEWMVATALTLPTPHVSNDHKAIALIECWLPSPSDGLWWKKVVWLNIQIMSPGGVMYHLAVTSCQIGVIYHIGVCRKNIGCQNMSGQEQVRYGVYVFPGSLLLMLCNFKPDMDK